MDAIYGRQSIDKKDSISIESQIEFCKYETRGREYRVYTDKGYSGKNTDRPQFQELLQDIKNGEIHRVIVYKLDRISRSILDFASMMQMFEQYGVEFVSSTEKFDTSTPMGRAMLNICVVFAQLERETIQKRVLDSYNARKKKGFYMGGKIPYGFSKEKIVINGIRTSKYIINPEEMEQVITIYEMYSNPTTSMRDIIGYFNENGIKQLRGGKWRATNLLSLVKNPIYVQADLDIYEFFKSQGVEIINPPSDFIGTNGCYLYKGENAEADKSVRLEGHTLVLAPHGGTIPSETWLKVRRKCLNDNKILKPNKAKNTWLSGKLKCKKCGYAILSRGSTKGEKFRYLFCQFSKNDNGCEGIHCMKTSDMEDAILNEIKEKLSNFKTLSREQSAAINPKINELRIKEKDIDNEIESLMEKLVDANDTLLKYINKRIVELDNAKKQILSDLNTLTLSQNNITNSKTIVDHVDKWDKLSFDDKRSVVDALIDKIMVSDESVEINWKI